MDYFVCPCLFGAGTHRVKITTVMSPKLISYATNDISKFVAVLRSQVRLDLKLCCLLHLMAKNILLKVLKLFLNWCGQNINE